MEPRLTFRHPDRRCRHPKPCSALAARWDQSERFKEISHRMISLFKYWASKRMNWRLRKFEFCSAYFLWRQQEWWFFFLTMGWIILLINSWGLLYCKGYGILWNTQQEGVTPSSRIIGRQVYTAFILKPNHILYLKVFLWGHIEEICVSYWLPEIPLLRGFHYFLKQISDQALSRILLCSWQRTSDN